MSCFNSKSGVWFPQGIPTADDRSASTATVKTDPVEQQSPQPVIAFVLVWGMLFPVAYYPVTTTVTRRAPGVRGVAITDGKFATLQQELGGSLEALRFFLETADTIAPDYVNGYLTSSTWSERRRCAEARMLIAHVSATHKDGHEIVDKFVY